MKIFVSSHEDSISRFYVQLLTVLVGLVVRVLEFYQKITGSNPSVGLSCLLTNYIVKLSVAQLYRIQRGNMSVGVLVVCDACQTSNHLLAGAHGCRHFGDALLTFL